VVILRGHEEFELNSIGDYVLQSEMYLSYNYVNYYFPLLSYQENATF